MFLNRAGIKNLFQWQTLTHGLLDTLLPPRCLACDTPVSADGQFCLPCFRAASFVSAPLCSQCGVPMSFGTPGIVLKCQRCLEAPPAFTQARAALRYDAMAQKLILPFKYADRTEVARGLARLMLRPGASLLAQADMLMPVPLHRTRLRQRRYNQAALLAAELARLASRPLRVDGLIRVKITLPLASLGLAARQEQLRDAIAVRPGYLVTGRRILLVDDVLTSGTTADACAQALLREGAAQVNVLTAARVADLRFD
jgi:ComF family protein